MKCSLRKCQLQRLAWWKMITGVCKSNLPAVNRCSFHHWHFHVVTQICFSVHHTNSQSRSDELVGHVLISWSVPISVLIINVIIWQLKQTKNNLFNDKWCQLYLTTTCEENAAYSGKWVRQHPANTVSTSGLSSREPSYSHSPISCRPLHSTKQRKRRRPHIHTLLRAHCLPRFIN